ncbi:MAG: hypothetical protein R3F43_27180 [bacterium]
MAARPHLSTRGQPPLIDDALLFTTDPEGARFTTVLVVAPGVAELATRLASLTTAVDPLFWHPEGAAGLGAGGQP